MFATPFVSVNRRFLIPFFSGEPFIRAHVGLLAPSDVRNIFTGGDLLKKILLIILICLTLTSCSSGYTFVENGFETLGVRWQLGAVDVAGLLNSMIPGDSVTLIFGHEAFTDDPQMSKDGELVFGIELEPLQQVAITIVGYNERNTAVYTGTYVISRSGSYNIKVKDMDEDAVKFLFVINNGENCC
jgi:hypothetical protein